jgi:acetoin utilization protein AcuB
MFARDLISDDIPPLRTSDSGSRALKWMDEFKVSHLPIVNKSNFLGLISDADILDMNDPESAIGSHELSLEKPFVHENQHFYDVIKVIIELNLTIVPVLDYEGNYIGSITLQSLVKKMADTTAVTDPGNIIILELNDKDYSMSEIAQIVEGNDAKILSFYITSFPNSTKLEITLKLNKTDVSGVLQSFVRYDYTIKASFKETAFEEDLKDRFDELMNYLNI